ncbi:MAG: Uma2 family endonuclease [Bacteroidota bacterium]
MSNLAPPRLRRFTVEEYHAIWETGILGHEARLELIDGQILTMSPFKRPHLASVNLLERALARRLYVSEPPLAQVSVQNPVRLDDGTEPEPDLALLRHDFADRFPTAADVFLVIEVADTTEAFDRNVKLPRYAVAGVPEVWLVLVGEDHGPGHAEIHRLPGPTGYGIVERHGPDGALTVAAFPELAPIPVTDILPPPAASAAV